MRFNGRGWIRFIEMIDRKDALIQELYDMIDLQKREIYHLNKKIEHIQKRHIGAVSNKLSSFSDPSNDVIYLKKYRY
jgi:hypothetical protein